MMPGSAGAAGGATFSFALGDYPHTAAIKSGLVSSDRFRLVFPPMPVISRAFAPMVRDQAYDISEMALATFLQAKAYGKPLVLLPVVTAARFQQAALICLAGAAMRDEAGLRGRRVGVRAYSQTTGVWLRGLLADAAGLAPQDSRWLTQEGAHVAEYLDPPWVERLGPGADLAAMLRAGAIDALIVGNDYAGDPQSRPVLADVAGSIRRFWETHRFIPVNHVVTMAASAVARQPDLPAELMRLFGLASYDLRSGGYRCRARGRAALQPSIELMLEHMRAQALLPPGYDPGSVWDGLPDDVG